MSGFSNVETKNLNQQTFSGPYSLLSRQVAPISILSIGETTNSNPPTKGFWPHRSCLQIIMIRSCKLEERTKERNGMEKKESCALGKAFPGKMIPSPPGVHSLFLRLFRQAGGRLLDS